MTIWSSLSGLDYLVWTILSGLSGFNNLVSTLVSTIWSGLWSSLSGLDSLVLSLGSGLCGLVSGMDWGSRRRTSAAGASGACCVSSCPSHQDLLVGPAAPGRRGSSCFSP